MLYPFIAFNSLVANTIIYIAVARTNVIATKPVAPVMIFRKVRLLQFIAVSRVKSEIAEEVAPIIFTAFILSFLSYLNVTIRNKKLENSLWMTIP